MSESGFVNRGNYLGESDVNVYIEIFVYVKLEAVSVILNQADKVCGISVEACIEAVFVGINVAVCTVNVKS